MGMTAGQQGDNAEGRGACQEQCPGFDSSQSVGLARDLSGDGTYIETSAIWYHCQAGHLGWGCCLGAFKVELLTSQGLHLVHTESGSFHIFQGEDITVLRGQRLCRGLELEQDGHGVQGLHLQRPMAGTMGGIKHKPQKTRQTSHFSGPTSPRCPGNGPVILQQKAARNQR